MSTRYNIMKPREDKEGKTRWDKAGTLFWNGDKGSIYIPALGQWFQVFKDEKREEKSSRPASDATDNNYDDDTPF